MNVLHWNEVGEVPRDLGSACAQIGDGNYLRGIRSAKAGEFFERPRNRNAARERRNLYSLCLIEQDLTLKVHQAQAKCCLLGLRFV